MTISANEYNYKELEAAAIKFNATQAEINALGEWFERYGHCYWNGECWTVDEQRDLHLYPIYHDIGDDSVEVVGYTFSGDPEDRFA